MRETNGAPPNTGRKIISVVLVMLLLGASHVWAQQQNDQAENQSKQKSLKVEVAEFALDVCKRIEQAALKWELPPAFFARLIWKESRFNPNAVSPAGAQGIAQFMPTTASLRKLEDPFDPKAAIAASAHYLSDLRSQFGNLGLAAAAYNAGVGRVTRWQLGRTTLPSETKNYVDAITGFSALEWNSKATPNAEYALSDKLAFLDACLQLPVHRSKLQPEYTTAPWQPWGVHLTADWTSRQALGHYAKLQRKHPSILGGHSPMVLRVRNPNFGSAHRFEIRIGQPNQAKAKQFCSRLTKVGRPCLVTRTELRW